MSKRRILILDDEPDMGALVQAVAEDLGHDAVTTVDPEAFEVLFHDHQPQVVVSDLQMGQHDGIETLRFIASQGFTGDVILMSGFDERVLKAAGRLGGELGLNVRGTLVKPLDIDALEALLKSGEDADDKDEPDVAEVSAAIKAGQIVPYFQPKYGLDASKIVGFEALARWQSPSRGTVSPGVFLPLVAAGDLIGPMTQAMMEAVAGQSRGWQAAGLGSHEIALNVDASLISHLRYPDEVSDIFSERGVDPKTITLEITESGAMAEAAATLDILSRFRLKGFQLSLDDFGTGYSSLVQLYRMPFSELKIDRSFVSDCDRDGEARAIVEISVELARRLNLTVCAEGVERQEEASLLRQLHCDKAQGFLWSRPLPADEATTLLTEQSAAGAERVPLGQETATS